jgi:hypothetical protein
LPGRYSVYKDSIWTSNTAWAKHIKMWIVL